MNKTKVSIVIPIYNVEKYLRECLDSVVNQTLKELEIICVNDGSTDRSLAILEEYASKDSRIKIFSKPNSGYGHTMNVGLDNSTGEYIGIVESDDYAELNMFEKLYNTAKENDLDISRGHYYSYNSKNNTNEKSDFSWVPKNKVFAPIDDNSPFFQPPSIWASIYKNELIKQNNIKFLETPGASYQDTSFAFKVYACAKRFMLIEEAFLHYRIDNEASSVNSLAKVYCVCDEYAEIEKFTKDKDLYKNFKCLIPKLQYGCYKWNYERLTMPHRYNFLKKWSKELLKYFINGRIDKSLFSKKEFKRIKTISIFPLMYKNRGAL